MPGPSSMPPFHPPQPSTSASTSAQVAAAAAAMAAASGGPHPSGESTHVVRSPTYGVNLAGLTGVPYCVCGKVPASSSSPRPPPP
eukprot:1155608-Pelagomonas_calceolata.AAC.5